MNRSPAIVLLASLLLLAASPAFPARAASPETAPARPPALSVTPPAVTDYAFLWWTHGYGNLSPSGRRILAIQTGRYGLTLDVDKVKLITFGPLRDARSYARAASDSNNVVFDLPVEKVRLSMVVALAGTDYRCVASAGPSSVRILDSGPTMQRCELRNLRFEDDYGQRLPASVRLEITAWPDRLVFLMECIPEMNFSQASASMRLFDGQEPLRAVGDRLAREWNPGRSQTCMLTWTPPGTENDDFSNQSLRITTDQQQIPAYYDPTHASWLATLPSGWFPRDGNQPERLNLTLANGAAAERVFRLRVTGALPSETAAFLPLLCDSRGQPTGLPVQVTRGTQRRTRMFFGSRSREEPCLDAALMVRIPPRTTATLQLAAASTHWAGLPAAAASPVSLSSGSGQVWEQVSLGTTAVLAFDPESALKNAFIPVLRPFLMLPSPSSGSPGGRSREPAEPGNVGGADFLVYCSDASTRQRLTRLRTVRHAPGPNLAETTFSGLTADGAIAAAITVATPRTDDLARSLQHLRYDVLKNAPFTRLAFFQLGADKANDHQFKSLAWGHAEGLAQELPIRAGGKEGGGGGGGRGGKGYEKTATPCPGSAPWWFSLHGAQPADKNTPWANRGLVIRSWKARLGGQDCPQPSFALVNTRSGGVASLGLELVPPANLTQLLPGDFLEADLELFALPMSPAVAPANAALRADLKANADTWKPVFRQARGNTLLVEPLRGTLARTCPLAIDVDKDQQASLAITGGLAWAPLTFRGLSSHAGYTLWQKIDGKVTPVITHREAKGPDWQTVYDPVTRTWERTYNVLLDPPSPPSPSTQPRRIEFLLRPDTAPPE